MPWTCRLVEYRPGEMKPGDMFYLPEDSMWNRHLSKHYQRDWAGKRKPLMVITPGGQWCIDGQSVSNGNFNQDGGWTVTGIEPNITVSPSINITGFYHGWLQNGVLTDDCEGRTYDAAPQPE